MSTLLEKVKMLHPFNPIATAEGIMLVGTNDSGKTTALRSMVEPLLRQGYRVVYVGQNGSGSSYHAYVAFTDYFSAFQAQIRYSAGAENLLMYEDLMANPNMKVLLVFELDGPQSGSPVISRALDLAVLEILKGYRQSFGVSTIFVTQSDFLSDDMAIVSNDSSFSTVVDRLIELRTAKRTHSQGGGWDFLYSEYVATPEGVEHPAHLQSWTFPSDLQTVCYDRIGHLLPEQWLCFRGSFDDRKDRLFLGWAVQARKEGRSVAVVNLSPGLLFRENIWTPLFQVNPSIHSFTDITLFEKEASSFDVAFILADKEDADLVDLVDYLVREYVKENRDSTPQVFVSLPNNIPSYIKPGDLEYVYVPDNLYLTSNV